MQAKLAILHIPLFKQLLTKKISNVPQAVL